MPSSIRVAPLLHASDSPTTPTDRHFSTFPLTSHLHTPTLRIVSLHPFLSLTCSIVRVPEIHDGFQWKLFISRSSTVHDAVDAIIHELGLAQSLAIPGGGNLEYVLEEVWSFNDRESEWPTYFEHMNKSFRTSAQESYRIPLDSTLSSVLESPLFPNPFPGAASRSYRFCIPDEWYRRSKSRSVSPTAPRNALGDLESPEKSEDESEGEGTAKQKALARSSSTTSPPTSPGFAAPIDWRGSMSQARLSSIFESWIHPSGSSSSSTSSRSERKSVSEPRLVEHTTGGNVQTSPAGSYDPLPLDQQQDEGVDRIDFEQMLVCIPHSTYSIYLINM